MIDHEIYSVLGGVRGSKNMVEFIDWRPRLDDGIELGYSTCLRWNS